MTCHQCHELSGQANKAVLVHTCGNCGAVWDQDLNAAINLRDYVPPATPAALPPLPPGSGPDTRIKPEVPTVRPPGGGSGGYLDYDDDDRIAPIPPLPDHPEYPNEQFPDEPLLDDDSASTEAA